MTCTEEGQCVPGVNPGMSTCPLGKPCEAKKRCVLQDEGEGGGNPYYLCEETFAGGTSCTSEANCNHFECEGAQCVENPGPGAAKCKPETEQKDCMHLACSDANKCVSVPGPKPHTDGCTTLGQKCKRAVIEDEVIDPLARLNPNSIGTSVGTLVGSVEAKTQVTVFQDLTCGMCRHAFDTGIRELLSRDVAAGTLSLRFIEYPLIPHSDGELLARAALCTNKNGYVSFLEQYYDHVKAKGDAASFLKTFSEKDRTELQSCMDSAATSQRLAESIAYGKASGVRGTPEIFLDGIQQAGIEGLKGSLARMNLEQLP